LGDGMNSLQYAPPIFYLFAYSHHSIRARFAHHWKPIPFPSLRAHSSRHCEPKAKQSRKKIRPQYCRIASGSTTTGAELPLRAQTLSSLLKRQRLINLPFVKNVQHVDNLHRILPGNSKQGLNPLQYCFFGV